MSFRMITRVGLLVLLMTMPILRIGTVSAAGVPQLVVSQFKITSSGGQFVTLYNQSNAVIDLAQYEFDYINSSNRLTNITMSGQLAAHGYYMLNDDQLRLCYQMTVNAVSLGFATTSGTVQVWQVSADKMTKQLQDAVTWASKATSGAVTLPTQNAANTVSMLRQPTDTNGNPQIAMPTSGTWQPVVPDAANPCTLNIINTNKAVSSPSNNPENRLSIGQAPPTTIVNLADPSDAASALLLPSEDVGLAAPQITELLPNPEGSGNDSEEEFIELYNSNPVPFHLVGFTLQTGAKTKHNYKFPDGTILSPKSFTAFYSIDTGLSLSNSSGQADLLDPFGTELGHTEPYGTAKDGQAWALTEGSWQWTSKATPNAVNIIVVTAKSTKSSGLTSNTAKTPGTVNGASATKTTPGNTDAGGQAAQSAPTHPYILAAIAVLAVGYGIYEYRHDLGNRLHNLRTNRAARRAARA